MKDQSVDGKIWSEWNLGRLAWGCGLDSTSSGQGPVAGCCECGDEPSGSCATELVMNYHTCDKFRTINIAKICKRVEFLCTNTAWTLLINVIKHSSTKRNTLFVLNVSESVIAINQF
jgi:hypothetical protein